MTTQASDIINQKNYQKTKLCFGINGTAVDLSTINPLPIADFMFEVAKENVTGISSVNKFGRSTNVDNGISTDIYDQANVTDDIDIWTAPTQARLHDIKSSSSSDIVGGAGARTIRVFGLPNWDTAEVNEDIIMNGINNVITSNSYVIIHRMKVLTKGATSANVGKITATAQVDNTVTAQINVNNGQTLMAIYGVPSVQTAYITAYYTSLNMVGGGPSQLNIVLLWNPEPNMELLNFLIRHTLSLQDTGQTYLRHEFKPYNKLEGPGILKIQCIANKDNQDVSAGFDVILVDN